MRNFLSKLVSAVAILGVLLAGMPVQEAHAASIIVNWDQEPAGLLSVVPDGHCTLREAVTNANSDTQQTGADCAAGSGADTISFAAAYTITLSLGQLLITSPMTIQDSNVNRTFLQAHASRDFATWRLFEVSPSGNLTLRHVAVRHGRCAGACPTATTQGGGIYVNGGTLIVQNQSMITSNAADYGGGIYNYGGTISIDDSTIINNTAGVSGGGIYHHFGSGTLRSARVEDNQADAGGGGVYNDNSSLTVLDTTFYGNDAGEGAGMYNLGSSPSLTGTLFTANITWGNLGIGHGEGAGMYNLSSNPALTNVTFERNRAGYGGGMANSTSNPGLDGVLFNENVATFDGAGMLNDDSSPTLQSVRFLRNTAEGNGGGIYSAGGSPSLELVTLESNSAALGGGMYSDGATLSLTEGTTFSGNTATDGAGMHNTNTNATITMAGFGNNIATGNGGAMYNVGSSPQITKVTFKGNSAANGGGIYNTGSDAPALLNVTFGGNGATQNGGAINNQSSHPTLTNVTLSGNSAQFGGGIYNFSSNPVLKNVILWGDTDPSGGPELYNLFSTPTIAYSVIQGGCASPQCSNIITADPLLGPLGYYGPGWTMALLPGSSAIDSADPESCPADDQRGLARPQDGDLNGTAACDIGAHETGFVTISGNAGAAGVVLSYTDVTAKTATTDASGDYSFRVGWHWAGSVIPSRAGCIFTPSQRFYGGMLDNASGQDFTADCRTPPADFNGDGASDVVVYRGGAWLFHDFDTGAPAGSIWTGNPGGSCIPAPMDYDGDGTKDFSQLCAGAWNFYSDDGTFLKGIWIGGGGAAIPVPADYDGDGTDDVMAFSGGAWKAYDFGTGTYSAVKSIWTGLPSGAGIPTPMDTDGNGTAEPTILANNGAWHFYNADGSYNKGIWIGNVAGQLPVPGDYDGDGFDDVRVFRGGAWLVYDFASGAYLPGSSVWTGAPPPPAGGGATKPAPLDYDGDGALDLTVFAGGPWHFYNDTGTYLKGIWVGKNVVDQPISRRPLP